MKIEHPTCPKCGKRARGTWEAVPGIALLRFEDTHPLAGAVADYAGETIVVWDEQKPVESPNGHSYLICHCGHIWESAIDWTDTDPGPHAAPDLLEACQEMLAWMQHSALDTVTTFPNAVSECIKAKAAIAKATGKRVS